MTLEVEEKPTSLESLKKDRLTSNDKDFTLSREMPIWIDKKKIERAKELFNKHAYSLLFGHLSGLLMIFLYTKHIEPFLITGKSSNFVSLLRRYVSTCNHVRKWYIGDIWNTEDAAYKSLMVVDEMHKNVILKLKPNYSSKELLYNIQFGTSMTQFAFVGIIVLFPQKLGINWGKEDMECFLHFWRCVGYLLGTNEKYNICAGNHKETLSLFRDILDNEIKPGIKNPRQESVKMARDIITVFSCFTPFLTWQSLCEYWADDLAIPRNFVLSLYDKISVFWFNFLFGILMWYQLGRSLWNSITRKAFAQVQSNMPYYEKLVFNYETKLLASMKNIDSS